MIRKGKSLGNVLVVAAHPDDEILGCGGTVARLAKAGHRCYSLILGEGIMSRYHGRTSRAKKEYEALRLNSRRAAKALGVKEVKLEGFPDNQFDKVPLLEIVKKIESHLKKIKPEIIYTHHAGDLNIDHRITFRAVLTATRPIKGQRVRQLYSFEIISATEWSFQKAGAVFSPNVFVDISKTLGKKIHALSFYNSEMKSFPHPRSIKNLKFTAGKWGATAGVEAAEAFELVRSLE